MQHGGPPTALAVTLAERSLTEHTGRSDFLAVRLAADFVRAVPVGDLGVRTRIVRAARSAALVEVVLAGGEQECLHVRVWFIRLADTSALASPLPPSVPVPDVASGLDAAFPYGESLEWRFVHGGMRTPGPAAAWVRPRISLLDGVEMSGLSRAALIADSASGLSAELDWTEWSFVNVDLDLHLVRPPVGEWLLLDASTLLGPVGVALARSTISDVHGTVGGGQQSLVLAPMRR